MEKLPWGTSGSCTPTAGSSFPFAAHPHTLPGLGLDGTGAGWFAALAKQAPAQGSIWAALGNGGLHMNINSEEVVMDLDRIPHYTE